MHFHKYPHASNFEFLPSAVPCAAFKTSRGRYRMASRVSGEGIHHVCVTGPGWTRNDSDAGLAFKAARSSAPATTLAVSKGRVRWADAEGRTLVSSPAGRFFGQCGDGWMFEFDVEDGDGFYGFGEKWTGLEHSDRPYMFWNTDLWADFHRETVVNLIPAPDPMYVSVPYAILKRGNTYIGLLIDNPHATFISVSDKTSIAGQMELGPARRVLRLAGQQGLPSLYFIYGPSLPELTRKLQRLVGTTPMPPAWALGYHQCRWGYKSAADLGDLDRKFREHEFPVDGLWIDIDYMRGYRVFTFDKKHFPDPAKALARLARRGRRVVPIIDPGVKNEPGYGVYDRGEKVRAFCLNPQGRNYVGLVWPGETVFPDFSDEKARAWWAREVAAFARTGIDGAWLDMNDPSTGPVENADMLFDRGRKSHSSYHNQYALGMAKATRDGFLSAWPDQRPFLLSRSGCTGTSRYAAIWTGDNFSSYAQLRAGIATTLNLALSGIPFNANDICGFSGDAFPELVRDWYKACFLFPVCRNHSACFGREQEPWTFGRNTLDVARHYIRLRYRLRPYLYQLFAAQEETGEAILRPLFYDFKDTRKLPLGKVDDQFLVGPCIMQAPFVDQDKKSRPVVLPGGTRWFDISTNRWINGGRKISVKATLRGTPLYVRDRSILPLARLQPGDHAFDAARADFHIFLSDDGKAQTRYVFDDGISFAYRKGKRSEVTVTATRKGRRMDIRVETLRDGFGPGDFTFAMEKAIGDVRVNGVPAKKVRTQGVNLCAKPLQTWAV